VLEYQYNNCRPPETGTRLLWIVDVSSGCDSDRIWDERLRSLDVVSARSLVLLPSFLVCQSVAATIQLLDHPSKQSIALWFSVINS
jgi:hypothetical protein